MAQSNSSSKPLPAGRPTLLAASLGWLLDSFSAMLYALVLAYVMRDLGMSKVSLAYA